MRTICIAGAKGGTRKTTTAVTLAAIYSTERYNVVLRDLDPQASATLALGQEVVPDPWLAEPVSVALQGTESGGLRLYRGGRTIAARSSEFPVPDPLPDLLILDTPPALGTLTRLAIERADLVVVPLEPGPLDLPALSDVETIVRGLPRRPLLRALLTRVQPRLVLTAEVIAHLEHNHPGLLYTTRIPQDVRAAEAPGFGVPVTQHAPRSRAADAYCALAQEIQADLGRMERRT